MCPVAFGAKGDFNEYQGLIFIPPQLAINHGENRELSLQLTSEDDSAQLQTTSAIVCIKGDNNFKWKEIFMRTFYND